MKPTEPGTYWYRPKPHLDWEIRIIGNSQTGLYATPVDFCPDYPSFDTPDKVSDLDGEWYPTLNPDQIKKIIFEIQEFHHTVGIYPDLQYIELLLTEKLFPATAKIFDTKD